jgi:hypothetical protein
MQIENVVPLVVSSILNGLQWLYLSSNFSLSFTPNVRFDTLYTASFLDIFVHATKKKQGLK